MSEMQIQQSDKSNKKNTQKHIDKKSLKKINKANQQKKMQLQLHHNQKLTGVSYKQKKHYPDPISLTISPYQYSFLPIKSLGNHSSFKKTTFSTRYNDHRLKYLDPDYFIDRTILDIGCNEGFLDIQIGMRFYPKIIYGVDIDYKIIKNAKKTIKYIVGKNQKYNDIFKRENQQKQQKRDNDNNQQQQKNKSICNRIQQLPLFFQQRIKDKFSLQSYLPLNIQLQFQSLYKSTSTFPQNILFQAQNIFSFIPSIKIAQYETILCLKVTKYIHLTYGDEGILRLFKKVYELLKQNGIFILQAQDWRSYKQQKSQYKIYEQNYNMIKIGPNNFQNILQQNSNKQFRFQLINKVQPILKQLQSDDVKKCQLKYPLFVFKKKSIINQ